MAVVRALFRALLPSYVSKGMSAAAMIREARAIGVLTYRRTDMLADIREVREVFRRKGMVMTWSRTLLPVHDLMTETALRRDRNYRVFADVIRQNTITGEIETKTVSFYSDELKTFEDWQNDYRSAVSEAQYEPEKVILSVDIWAIEHNAGWAY